MSTLHRDDLCGGRYAFAHFEGFEDDFEMSKKATLELARMAQDEEWGDKFRCLTNNIKHLFKYVVHTQPGKIKVSRCGLFAAFDTRLRDATGGQKIYAVFSKNTRPQMQPWVWLKWCCGWDQLTKIARTPADSDSGGSEHAAFDSEPPMTPE